MKDAIQKDREAWKNLFEQVETVVDLMQKDPKKYEQEITKLEPLMRQYNEAHSERMASFEAPVASNKTVSKAQ